jgi:hypothetical protein
MNGNDGQAGCRPKRWDWVGVRLLIFALVAEITTASCSFTWVTRPAPWEEAPQYTALPQCTDSYWMPVLDTAAVALFIAAITNVSLNTSPGTIRSYTLGADSALGLTALASAIYGYYYVAECRQQDLTVPIPRPYSAPQPADGGNLLTRWSSGLAQGVSHGAEPACNGEQGGQRPLDP